MIKGTVTLEDNVTVMSHAYIDGNTTIGSGTIIHPFAVIGAKAQDLKFRGEKTFLVIGKNCVIREYVTIHSPCKENAICNIGDDCMLMEYSHVAHNCNLGRGVVLMRNAILGGYASLGDFVKIQQSRAIYPCARVGSYSNVSDYGLMYRDVLPYTLFSGLQKSKIGLNKQLLKEHCFSNDTCEQLEKALNLIYHSDNTFKQSLNILQTEFEPIPEILHLIEFCKNSKRGFIGSSLGRDK